MKVEQSFLADAVILHEAYFDILGLPAEVPLSGTKAGGEVIEAIAKDFGSFEKWQEEFKGLGMASRGWVILAYDFNDGKLRNYIADAHNLYAVWGAAPIAVLDMYEHAYFIDFGSDKKAYIEAYFQNLDWQKIDQKYAKITRSNP